jgi:hypothetical protein
MGTTGPDELRQELTKVDDVSGADEGARAEVAQRTETVEQASAALRRALQELREADDAAWKRYATEVEHATLRFDAALGIAAATLRAERAASKPELADALDSVVRSWRARADELRLQAHLGEMEAHDAGLHAVDVLEAAGDQVASVLVTVRDDTGQSLDALRTAGGRAIDGLGRALQNLRPGH